MAAFMSFKQLFILKKISLIIFILKILQPTNIVHSTTALQTRGLCTAWSTVYAQRQ